MGRRLRLLQSSPQHPEIWEGCHPPELHPGKWERPRIPSYPTSPPPTPRRDLGNTVLMNETSRRSHVVCDPEQGHLQRQKAGDTRATLGRDTGHAAPRWAPPPPISVNALQSWGQLFLQCSGRPWPGRLHSPRKGQPWTMLGEHPSGHMHAGCRFSRVRLFATPWTVALQAPLSVGFSKQEHWTRLLFPSPGDLPKPGIRPRDRTCISDVSCIGRLVLYHERHLGSRCVLTLDASVSLVVSLPGEAADRP